MKMSIYLYVIDEIDMKLRCNALSFFAPNQLNFSHNIL